MTSDCNLFKRGFGAVPLSARCRSKLESFLLTLVILSESLEAMMQEESSVKTDFCRLKARPH